MLTFILKFVKIDMKNTLNKGEEKWLKNKSKTSRFSPEEH